MWKLVENCVHSFVKNPMNFMSSVGLFLLSVTLVAAPQGGSQRVGCLCGRDGAKGKDIKVFYSISWIYIHSATFRVFSPDLTHLFSSKSADKDQKI